MEELGYSVADARKRIALLASLARFTWVVNLIVAVACLSCRRYEVASAAGYFFVISLLLAAYCHRAARQLANLEQIIVSTRAPRNLVAVDTVS